MPYLVISFKETLTIDIVSFEQLGPDLQTPITSDFSTNFHIIFHQTAQLKRHFIFYVFYCKHIWPPLYFGAIGQNITLLIFTCHKIHIVRHSYIADFFFFFTVSNMHFFLN